MSYRDGDGERRGTYRLEEHSAFGDEESPTQRRRPDLQLGRMELQGAIARYLSGVDSYTKKDIYALYPPDMPVREMNLELWAVTEGMRRELGIVFRPDANNSVFRRANPAEISRRGDRFFWTGRKKVQRAIEVLRLGASLTEDPVERARLERLALRRANDLVSLRAEARAAGRARPRGV